VPPALRSPLEIDFPGLAAIPHGDETASPKASAKARMPRCAFSICAPRLAVNRNAASGITTSSITSPLTRMCGRLRSAQIKTSLQPRNVASENGCQIKHLRHATRAWPRQCHINEADVHVPGPGECRSARCAARTHTRPPPRPRWHAPTRSPHHTATARRRTACRIVFRRHAPATTPTMGRLPRSGRGWGWHFAEWGGPDLAITLR
jgi:hypothetical protein